jgi:hypothetical protein
MKAIRLKSWLAPMALTAMASAACAAAAADTKLDRAALIKAIGLVAPFNSPTGRE